MNYKYLLSVRHILEEMPYLLGRTYVVIHEMDKKGRWGHHVKEKHSGVYDYRRTAMRQLADLGRDRV